MEYVIPLVGFFGGWLLFAGPLQQAWLELRSEEIDRDGIGAAAASIPRPKRVSGWWWLLPPVAWYKATRGQRAYRDAVNTIMTDVQREQMLSFSNKARAWFIVAGGAFFIAVKETWEAVEKFELWVGVFWILIVALPLACVVAQATLAVRTQQALGREKPAPRPRRERS